MPHARKGRRSSPPTRIGSRTRPARRAAPARSRPSPETWAPLVDRFELFNRDTLFSWVAEAGLPAVASGDFHEEQHLATWKTMLPCPRTEASVLAYLRSSRPAFLVNLAARDEPLSRAA